MEKVQVEKEIKNPENNEEEEEEDMKSLKQAPPLKQSMSLPTEGGDFKNSLASLLAKGNPLMGGGPRKTVQKKQEKVKEVEEEKEKIKVDIFNEEEFDENCTKMPELTNVMIYYIDYDIIGGNDGEANVEELEEDK